MNDSTSSHARDSRLLKRAETAREHDNYPQAILIYSVIIWAHGEHAADARHMRGVTFGRTMLLKRLGRRDLRKALSLRRLSQGSDSNDANLARTLRDLGKLEPDDDMAENYLDESVTLYEQVNDPVEAAMSKAFKGRRKLRDIFRGRAYHTDQNIKAALEPLEEASAVFYREQNNPYRMYNLAYLTRAYLLNRRWQEAAMTAMSYERLAKEHGGKQRQLEARWLRWRIRHHLGYR